MEPINNEAGATDRGLCELKTEGFVRSIDRVLDLAVPGADLDGIRRYEGSPYTIEKQDGVLTVWAAGKLVLQVGNEPGINRLTARDLFNIVRMETRLIGKLG